MDRKGSRENPRMRYPKKRKVINSKVIEKDTSFTEASAEKFRKTEPDEQDVILDQTNGFCFLNFYHVFSTISQLVICKTCEKEVKFSQSGVRGLGFRVNMDCECGTTRIDSSPVVKYAFEINRRFVFVMRLLGLGRVGLNLFCALMDISQGMTASIYYACLENVHCAAKAVCEVTTKRAVSEETERRLTKDSQIPLLAVSGETSCRKRGDIWFSVANLRGQVTGKILDILVRSRVQDDDSDEHPNPETVRDRVDAILEMFSRSQSTFGVKYSSYADEDDKVSKGVTDAAPYEGHPVVKKAKWVPENEVQSHQMVLQSLWKLAPEGMICGQKSVEIAAFLATIIANEGFQGVLQVLAVMGVTVGPNSNIYANNQAEKASMTKTIEKKTKSGVQKVDLFEMEEGIL